MKLQDDPDPGCRQVDRGNLAGTGRSLCTAGITVRSWHPAAQGAGSSSRILGARCSEDEGLELALLPRDPAPAGSLADRSWQNGFFAGGYGDLSVVPARAGEALYLFFTSYHPDEDDAGRGGTCACRRWTSRHRRSYGAAGWVVVRRSNVGTAAMACGARFSSWRPGLLLGPAVHYNRALDAYVMLLNRTAGGDGDLLQEGIYASINTAIDDPAGWTPPLQIVRGGAWYPQAIGLEEGCGDTEAAAVGRFFMAGFSAWEIEIRQTGGSGARRTGR